MRDTIVSPDTLLHVIVLQSTVLSKKDLWIYSRMLYSKYYSYNNL